MRKKRSKSRSSYLFDATVPRNQLLQTTQNEVEEEVVQFALGRFRLDQNPAAVYVSRLAPNSRRTMKQCLNTMASLLTSGRNDALNLPWWELSYQHTAALRSVLCDKYAPATANKMLAALRGCLKECQRLGLMSADDYARATDIKNLKFESMQRGRALKPEEIAALMKACLADSSPAGYRDAALLAIARAGLRRSEIIALEVTDFNEEVGSVTVRGGKGRRDRIVYLPSGGVKAVSDWVELRNKLLGMATGALINPIDRFGVVGTTNISDTGATKILRKRATQAGVEWFSPHDFRRTFIGDLLDAGADIVTVQKLAGHADPATTSRYDRRGEAAKQAAVLLLDLPYQR